MRDLAVAAGLVVALVGANNPAAAQFPPDSFTNLKVLPKDIGQRELIDLMASFTRALGVRCTHCHVGEEGQPLATYDFPSDDKLSKRKARVMIDMVQHINGRHLADVPERVEPPLEVQCMTCHRGVTEPRMLQDVLLQAYAAGGLDSTRATYDGLRRRYYGRAAYDFGEVPLIDVANRIRAQGSLADAVALHALNVELHPDSRFAKQQFAAGALLVAFVERAEAGGAARYRELRERYGAEAFSPFFLGQVGEALLEQKRVREAVALYRLTVEAYPDLAAAHAALGDAYVAAADTSQAIASYEKALQLNPQHRGAAAKLRELRGGSE